MVAIIKANKRILIGFILYTVMVMFGIVYVLLNTGDVKNEKKPGSKENTTLKSKATANLTFLSTMNEEGEKITVDIDSKLKEVSKKIDQQQKEKAKKEEKQ